MTEETAPPPPLLLLLLPVAALPPPPTEFMTTEDPGLECCDDDDPDESDVETLPAPFPDACAEAVGTPTLPWARRASSAAAQEGCACASCGGRLN